MGMGQSNFLFQLSIAVMARLPQVSMKTHINIHHCPFSTYPNQFIRPEDAGSTCNQSIVLKP